MHVSIWAQGILCAALAAAVLGGIWWWRARRGVPEASPMVSLVALLREPMVLNPQVLALKAGQAWKADLGDGVRQGADGFVVADGPIGTVVYQDIPYLINCLPVPYVSDPAATAETIADGRRRRLFAAHRAWFSCDALDVDRATTAEQKTEHYRRAARLLAEFLDESWLLIYAPEFRNSYTVDGETVVALRSDDPLAALDEAQQPPVIQVPPDDPAMLAAVAQAREAWPEFVEAFEARAGEEFAVKAPLSHAERTEFIWLMVTAMEGDRVLGELANEPNDLGPLRLGSKVVVPVAEVSDWYFIDPLGDARGAFTAAAVHEALRRQAP